MFDGLSAICLGQGPHEIQLLTLLVGINGRSLVMIDELIQIVELSLANAVHVAFDVNPEVLVPSRRFK